MPDGLRGSCLESLFPLHPERRIREDHVHAVLVADLGELVTQRITVVDLRSVETV